MQQFFSVTIRLGLATSVCSLVSWLNLASVFAQESPSVVISKLAKSQQPRLAIDRQDTIYCVFGAGEAIYCNHTELAEGFSQPIKIASIEKLAVGRRRGPRICLSDEAIVVTAISHQTGQVLSWRSVDQGATWSDSMVVNDAEGSAKEGLHAMAVSPAGQLCCVWLDFRNEKMELFGAISNDQGQSWEANVKIYTSPEKNICECCHPSVTYDEDGGLHVMWRNSIGGNRDMYSCYSKDGIRFSEAIQLGKLHWELNQCPMDGGEIVARSHRDLVTIWRRGSTIVLSEGADQETPLGMGEQPVLALTKQGSVAIWLKRRGGDLLMLRSGQEEPEVIAKRANDPCVVAAGHGLFIAYEATEVDDAPSLKLLSITSLGEKSSLDEKSSLGEK